MQGAESLRTRSSISVLSRAISAKFYRSAVFEKRGLENSEFGRDFAPGGKGRCALQRHINSRSQLILVGRELLWRRSPRFPFPLSRKITTKFAVFEASFLENGWGIEFRAYCTWKNGNRTPRPQRFSALHFSAFLQIKLKLGYKSDTFWLTMFER